jgi:anti-sigma regulatory factor (Ser/Thr protein kinase)
MEALTTSLRAHHIVAIEHASDIAAARRAGQTLAQLLDFDEVRAGQLALLISESATNIIKHARDGAIHMYVIGAAGPPAQRGIEIVAIDRGPGIGNLANALRDGVSSAGTAGNGLGAMRRLADDFDVFAPRDGGAVFYMRLWQLAPEPATTAPAAACEFGALTLPLAGEDSNGDGWAMAADAAGVSLLLSDGLGHGDLAAAATAAAIECMTANPSRTPQAQIEACHGAMRDTRGAAMAVARYDAASGTVRFIGVGNIAACIVETGINGDGKRRQLVSHNGIVGHNMRKLQEFVLPCPPGSLLILHSDGLSATWDLDAYPGLAGHHPALIAAVLLRDAGRARDDASIVVLRCAGGAALGVGG